ncbi:Uncharacterised protein [Mycobacteroides abscessus subsp. abscessus]|nr:Uncharacterised protein [Mycobacteroides abscessus subsp. abscessus]
MVYPTANSREVLRGWSVVEGQSLADTVFHFVHQNLGDSAYEVCIVVSGEK